MYRSILIPVAYEPGFDLARERAAGRALADADARITLLHVMEPVPFYAIDYLPKGWRAELKAAIEADLRVQAEDLGGADVVVIEGDPGRAIVDRAMAEGSDCIVLATHRVDRRLFGSTASWVARHAPCAVHLIR